MHDRLVPTTGLLALLALACTAPTEQAEQAERVAVGDAPVDSWGTMREALREGRSQGRVALADVAGGGAIGVGALAGLAGEVTIVDGRVLVARSDRTGCEVTDAAPSDEATLLVRAAVERWIEVPLADCASYDDLEAAVAAAVAAAGLDPERPTPVRIRGDAARVAYHVIAGSCPVATPDGTPPWRYDGPLAGLELVGVFVENAAGRWTHHMRRSHLHVVADGRMGHLDELELADATLLLPARSED